MDQLICLNNVRERRSNFPWRPSGILCHVESTVYKRISFHFRHLVRNTLFLRHYDVLSVMSAKLSICANIAQVMRVVTFVLCVLSVGNDINLFEVYKRVN